MATNKTSPEWAMWALPTRKNQSALAWPMATPTNPKTKPRRASKKALWYHLKSNWARKPWKLSWRTGIQARRQFRLSQTPTRIRLQEFKPLKLPSLKRKKDLSTCRKIQSKWIRSFKHKRLTARIWTSKFQAADAHTNSKSWAKTFIINWASSWTRTRRRARTTPRQTMMTRQAARWAASPRAQMSINSPTIPKAASEITSTSGKIKSLKRIKWAASKAE